MRSFVLDENCSYKDLIMECNAEMQCTLNALPEKFRSQKDPDFICEALSGTSTFITNDWTIIEENLERIPSSNRGIIVVRQRRSASAMTRKRCIGLIAEFKKRYPRWPHENWDNIWLTITESEIFIRRLCSTPSENRVIKFEDTNFRQTLSAEITRLSESLN